MRSRIPGGRWRTGALLAASLAAAGGIAVVTVPMASAAECSDVEVVVARGTNEPGGLGLIVGDPVFDAIQDRLAGGNVTSHAVDYPASLNPNSPAEGNRALVDHVTAQAQECAGQRFVLVGYSQGANVVGNSLGTSSENALVGAPVVATIPAEIQPQVAAVLVFGYPLRKQGGGIEGELADRTLDVCANGDVICDPDGASVIAHLSYRGNAGEAADFAVEKLQ
jgi:cutinase